MEIARAIDVTGEVWLRNTLGDGGTTIGLVHFSPDARTRWHRHATGQFR